MVVAQFPAIVCQTAGLTLAVAAFGALLLVPVDTPESFGWSHKGEPASHDKCVPTAANEAPVQQMSLQPDDKGCEGAFHLDGWRERGRVLYRYTTKPCFISDPDSCTHYSDWSETGGGTPFYVDDEGCTRLIALEQFESGIVAAIRHESGAFFVTTRPYSTEVGPRAAPLLLLIDASAGSIIAAHKHRGAGPWGARDFGAGYLMRSSCGSPCESFTFFDALLNPVFSRSAELIVLAPSEQYAALMSFLGGVYIVDLRTGETVAELIAGSAACADSSSSLWPSDGFWSEDGHMFSAEFASGESCVVAVQVRVPSTGEE